MLRPPAWSFANILRLTRSLMSRSAVSCEHFVSFAHLELVSLNMIKFYFPLGSTVESTFISFSKDLIRDMAGNSAVEILSTNGKPATTAQREMQSPELNYFNINMSSAVLTMYFSETVNVSSILIDSLRLQGNFNISGDNYTLTSASLLTPVIVI